MNISADIRKAKCYKLNAVGLYRGATLMLVFLLYWAEVEAAAEPVVWTDTVGVSVSGNTITKTAGNAWNAGAASTQSISADGYVEHTAKMIDKARFIGLSTTNASVAFTTIHYGLITAANGDVSVYESGTLRGTFGAYAINDVLRVERVGTTVYYKKNGAILYTSAVPSSGSLILDASLYHTAGSLFGVMIETGGPLKGAIIVVE